MEVEEYKRSLEEQEDAQEDLIDEQTENQTEASEIMRQALGEESDKYGQHAFIRDSVFALANPIRTTFLHPEEKGKPLFSVLFLCDMTDLSYHYLKPIIVEMENKHGITMENKIAKYFEAKVLNVCNAGMSNKGFIQNLNATRRISTEKRKFKPHQPKES